MTDQQIERAAFMVAHRLMTTDTSAPELACPGARRSRMVENIAAVIIGVFEIELSRSENGRRTTKNEPAMVAAMGGKGK